MLSPFIVSKTMAGWVGMLYSGFLCLFFVCLLAAIGPRSSKHSRWMPYLLLATAFLILFSGTVTAVFAVNLTICTFVWQGWSSRQWRETLRRFYKALLPTILASFPYLAMVAYYIIKFGFQLKSGRRTGYLPEPIMYLLPFTGTSIYNRWVLELGFFPARGMGANDTACYLGLLVLPLCLAGLIAWRRKPIVRLCTMLFLLFLVLSIGPKLLFNREIVRIGNLQVRLPFALWQEIPILGAVRQSGRYLVISYMMMSVGLACLVAELRSRLGAVRGVALAALLALVVCTDFAFRPLVAKLPPVPEFSSAHGLLLDPRLRSGLSMYYQTYHEQPLVGGYLSRKPAYALRLYQAIPSTSCLVLENVSACRDRETLLASLVSLGVTYVLLDPGDWRGSILEQYGLRQHYADSFTVVWAVPDSGDRKP
jgi:hypothetical protein